MCILKVESGKNLVSPCVKRRILKPRDCIVPVGDESKRGLTLKGKTLLRLCLSQAHIQSLKTCPPSEQRVNLSLGVLAGAFSPKAEVTNGRAAMLGIAVVLLLEQNAGASFF